MSDDAELPEDKKRAVSEALTSLLADNRFRASDRNKRFLAFVVENTLEGHSDRIKGYSIAVDVFGREPSFDSAIDPIVRIEAGRLRAALASYYDKHGAHVRVRFEIPKGAYRPNFVFTSDAPAAAPPQTPKAAPAKPGKPSVLDRLRSTVRALRPGRAGRSAAVAAVVGAGVLSAAAIGLWASGAGRAAQTAPILVVGSVAPLDDERATATHARTLTKSLTVALGQFPGLTVIPQPASRDLDQLVASEIATHRPAPVFVLRVAVRGDTHLQYYATLANAATSETVWSEQRAAPQAGEALAEDLVARRIAGIVASVQGMLPALDRRRSTTSVEPGPACVQFALSVVAAPTPDGLMTARQCLERTVSSLADTGPAWGLLARVRAADLGREGPPARDSVEGVQAAAARAGVLAPLSPGSHAALLVSAVAAGDEAKASATAIRLAEMCAADPALRAFAAMTLWRLGHHDRARAIIEQTAAVFAHGLPVDRSVLAFEAYREGRIEDALRELTAPNPIDPIVARAVEAAAAARAGDAPRSEAASRALRQVVASLDRLAEFMTAQRYRQGFIEQLLADLRPMVLTRL